jgi:hypothetical protein
VLDALAGAGLDGRQQVVGFRCLTAYVIGALQNEFFTSLADAATMAATALSRADYSRAIAQIAPPGLRP